MSKNQKNFFDKLQPWSKIKNDLLSTYLAPYFSKITNTRRDTFYVDCFAGQGKFDDGNDGSPFLALRIRNEVLAKKQTQHGDIKIAFIEKEYGEILKKNLSLSFPHCRSCNVISGTFEADLAPLVQQHQRENLFLYVDPFGIKSLQYSVFKTLASCGMFPSVEVLMNFNTFGFIRAARSILSQSEQLPNKWDANGLVDKTEALDELVPFESSLKTVSDLNSVANGDYWIDIIKKHANSPQGFKRAEKEFSTAYHAQLSKVFNYVLKMPIGKKDGSIPEYCMYFMTNHPDACLIMVDNMMKRSEDLRIDVQQKGQMDLFARNVENDLVDSEQVHSDFVAFLKTVLQGNGRQSSNTLKARFFSENGVVCKSTMLNKVLEELEASGRIFVVRTPLGESTKPAKRPSRSFDTKRFDIRISWNV